MRFLDTVSCVLLDLNGTFMFDFDRLGDGQDFAATWRRLGGGPVDTQRLHGAIQATCALAFSRSDDPLYVDRFPRLMDFVRTCAGSFTLDDQARITELIAIHEVGTVPREHAAFIRALARTHRLGLVSNIWSPKTLWEAELTRAGVLKAFSSLVWSSEGSCIKPSPTMFRRALRALGAEPHETAMVGDSLRCDIHPARALGLRTVWVNPEGQPSSEADLQVSSLPELGSRMSQK